MTVVWWGGECDMCQIEFYQIKQIVKKAQVQHTAVYTELSLWVSLWLMEQYNCYFNQETRMFGVLGLLMK